jgi:hypothetical protein
MCVYQLLATIVCLSLTCDDKHLCSSSSTVSRRNLSLLRCSIRAWTDIADEIKNRPQLAEADMWYSRRLLRRVVASWDRERLLIRTRFAQSSRSKGSFSHAALRSRMFISFSIIHFFRADLFQMPASQSRLEAALEKEMHVQLQLNYNMQVCRNLLHFSMFRRLIK